METVRSADFLHLQDDPAIINLQRFWGRRITSSQPVDDDFFFDEISFPSQDVDDALLKSRTCSPAPQAPWDAADGDSDKENSRDESESEVLPLMCLDAAALGDIPARYVVPSLPSYEFPVVGVYIDPRVVPGFMYKVRVLPEQDKPEVSPYLFDGKALRLLSIGRGYSKRMTFEPDTTTTLNDNCNYFWSDSRSKGFGFELQVLSPNGKFMIHDPSRLVAGTLEIMDIQGHQEEVSHKVLKDQSIEKRAKVKAMCKIEWFDDSGTTVLQPMSGMAVALKRKGREISVLTRIVSVTIGRNSKKRGFTLTPGVKTNWRRTVVNGSSIGDVPAKYTLTGLEPYELPVIVERDVKQISTYPVKYYEVITFACSPENNFYVVYHAYSGTYVDPRIICGFRYKVRCIENKKNIFNGKALELVSIGMGYGKKITFLPNLNEFNQPDNYFWSDSLPGGYGFEPVALDAGLKFVIRGNGRTLGRAQIFRIDAPQKEIRQKVEKTKNGFKITKYIEIDVTCHVTLLPQFANDKVMRVTGIAVLCKNPKCTSASLLQIQNIGLDSQINLLFVHEEEELFFLPE